MKPISMALCAAVATATPALAQTADAGGYATESIAVDYVNLAAVGSPVSVGSSSTVEVALPWAFPFYGNPYPSVRVHPHGGLSFRTVFSSTSSNACLPSSGSGHPDVAVCWDSLSPAIEGDVYSWHDVDQDRFLVSWQRVRRGAATPGR